jgi:hypothetical protein
MQGSVCCPVPAISHQAWRVEVWLKLETLQKAGSFKIRVDTVPNFFISTTIFSKIFRNEI